MRQSTWHAFFVRCSKSEYSMSLRFRNASSPCAHVCALHYRRRTASWHTCSGVLEYRVMAHCMHTMPHKHTYAHTHSRWSLRTECPRSVRIRARDTPLVCRLVVRGRRRRSFSSGSSRHPSAHDFHCVPRVSSSCTRRWAWASASCE